MPTIFRDDQHRISVNVTGVPLDNVSWDYLDGGEIDPNMLQFNPGGMASQIAVGGMRHRGDITVRRAWGPEMVAVFVALDNASGTASASVSVQAIKADRKTNGSQPFTYTGVLGKVTRPTADASTGNVVYLEIVISPNEAMS